MALFVKQGSTWKSLTNFFVKQGSVWTPIKYAYVKIGSIWTLFYPKAGPYTTTLPYISTDTAGNSIPPGNTLNTGGIVYLQKGVWNGNGYTISSYNYTFGTSSNSNPGTGGTINRDSGSLINYAQETLTPSIYDGLYVVGNIVANTTTSGVTGSDSTDSNGYRYFVARKYPPTEASGYLPYITSNPTSTETVVSAGDLIVRGASSFTYQNVWNGTVDYLPDSTRSSVIWYSSTNGSYTSAAQIVANATYASSPTKTITSNGALYTVSSTFTPSSVPQGTYYYAVDYEYNSNTDFNINPSTKYAVVGPINNSPTPNVYPTLTAVTPSGYTGNQNSFTVGATITGSTGSWTPTPNGPYPVLSSFKYSLSNSISLSSQVNWNAVTSPSSQTGIQDTLQYQNHSFVLGSSVASGVSSASKYLEYAVTAENGNGANSSSDFYTNAQLIYPAPIAQTITSMTWTADNSANVTGGNLYFSDHYQLTYSTSSTTSSGSWTPIGNISYSSFISTPYSGLPSGTYYYSIISYNADGVGIYGPVFSYNSTPSPDVPTFTYDYGSSNLYNGTITVTANKSTSISATIYRSASSSWGTTTTYDTAISYNTNKLYYSIPTSGYYYLYVTATNAHGSTTAYSYLNNPTFFYAGIPIGTTYQSVYSQPSYVEIDLSWTPANWQSYSPYTGDNITYINNNSSYEIYRSTSSSTPSGSSTPTYAGLTNSYYADTTGLSTGTTYYYWIRGRNNNTYGVWQYMGSAKTYLPPNPQPFTTISGTKAYPTGATQSTGEPTQSRVLSTSWNASTNATYYEVQYEGSFDNTTWTILQSFTQSSLITATSNSYTAIYKRYYRFAVRATPNPYSITYAAYSDGGSSGSLQYYYITGTSPTAPTIGTITLGTGASYSSVTVNYTFSSNPGSNTINYNYWSLDNANFTAVYSTSFNIGSLSASTTYTVYIKSLNYDNLYSATSSQSFTTNAAPVYYTVTFNGNGGTPSSTSVTQSTVGGSITAPAAPNQTSYTFNGWYNASSGGSLIVGANSSYTPTSNIQLYAQWTYVPPAPAVSSSPTLSGSGVAGTSLTASNGSYTNASITDTAIAYSTSSSIYTGFLYTSAPGATRTSPYTVTTNDATNPAYYFWAYNQILGFNGTTYYVYSSPTLSSLPPTYAPNIPSYTAQSNGNSTTTRLNFIVNITAPTVDGSHSDATSYTLYVQAGTSSSGPFSNVSTTITTTGGSGSGTSASPYTTSGTPAPVSGYFQVTGSYTWVRAYVKANNSGGSSSYGSGAVG